MLRALGSTASRVLLAFLFLQRGAIAATTDADVTVTKQKVESVIVNSPVDKAADDPIPGAIVAKGMETKPDDVKQDQDSLSGTPEESKQQKNRFVWGMLL